MPRVQRRETQTATGDYTYWHVYQLMGGGSILGLGFGWDNSLDRAAMVEAWKVLGPVLTAWHISLFPGTRPRMWYEVDAPEPPDEAVWPSQYAYLEHHDLLTPAEVPHRPPDAPPSWAAGHIDWWKRHGTPEQAAQEERETLALRCPEWPKVTLAQVKTWMGIV